MSMRAPGATRRLVVSALAVLACAAALPAEASGKPGPNLLPNPGFEESRFEGNPLIAPGSLAQPLLPVGWTFEGLSILFDHSPNVRYSGKRSVAISGSLSTPRRICQNGTCQDNPANPVRDSLAPTARLRPSWLTAAPVPVAPNIRYTLSAWIGWDIMTVGLDAATSVRWLRANGTLIAEETASKVVATAENSTLLDWKQFSHVLKSPAEAASAHIVLSHADDLWNSQVRFDDVYFGTAP